MYAIVFFETLVIEGTRRICCFESFGDVLKSQLVGCVTSCVDHLVEQVCRHHASMNFEQIEKGLSLTSSVGSQTIEYILGLRPTISGMISPAISSSNFSVIILFVS